MTVIRNNSISGINSITAQSGALNFYDSTGNTLAISADVTGGVTVATGATISGSTNTITASTNGSERFRIASDNTIHMGSRDGNLNSTIFGKAFVNIVGRDPINTGFAATSCYLQLGGTESETNGLYPIGFGYRANASTHVPAYIAYKTTNSGAAEYGDLLFATRDVTTDTEPSERLRVTSDGNIEIANGNLVFSTSGTGIDFSATANGSGTTNSELFDDYEEGSFTPAWGDGSSAYSSPAPTYSTQRGDYTKVGNVVYYDIHLITTAWNSAGNSMWPHGLPFTTRSSGYQLGGGGIFCILGVDDAGAISNLTTQIAPSTTRVELYFQNASTGANYSGFGVNHVNENGTVSIRISGFYFTDS